MLNNANPCSDASLNATGEQFPDTRVMCVLGLQGSAKKPSPLLPQQGLGGGGCDPTGGLPRVKGNNNQSNKHV